MSFFSRIFRTCDHKWITDREVPLATHNPLYGEKVIGARYYQHCDRCGDVRKKDLDS